MGSKLVWLFLVVVFTVVSYLVLTVLMPTITSWASTANTTISASSNMTGYFGLQGALLGAPLWLYMAPGCIAVIAIIIILKIPEKR